MQNLIQKFRQGSFVFQNTGFLSENWRAPTTIEFNIFCENFAHVSYLPMSTKECSGFFHLFRSWVICKNIFLFAKRPGFYAFIFYNFINNSRSKQNKNSITTFCRHC